MNRLTNDGLSNLKPQWPWRRGGGVGLCNWNFSNIT